MSVVFTTYIRCDDWLDADDCESPSNADHDGDGFIPTDDGWVTVESSNDEDGGTYYCPTCAKRRGITNDD